MGLLRGLLLLIWLILRVLLLLNGEEVIHVGLIGGLYELILVSGSIYEYIYSLSILVWCTGICYRGGKLELILHGIFVLTDRSRCRYISVLIRILSSIKSTHLIRSSTILTHKLPTLISLNKHSLVSSINNTLWDFSSFYIQTKIFFSLLLIFLSVKFIIISIIILILVFRVRLNFFGAFFMVGVAMFLFDVEFVWLLLLFLLVGTFF